MKKRKVVDILSSIFFELNHMNTLFISNSILITCRLQKQGEKEFNFFDNLLNIRERVPTKSPIFLGLMPTSMAGQRKNGIRL